MRLTTNSQRLKYVDILHATFKYQNNTNRPQFDTRLKPESTTTTFIVAFTNNVYENGGSDLLAIDGQTIESSWKQIAAIIQIYFLKFIYKDIYKNIHKAVTNHYTSALDGLDCV